MSDVAAKSVLVPKGAIRAAFAGETFDDGGSDAPTASGDKSAFVL